MLNNININEININENKNFLNDYIEYHFQKEKKKFSKLKYNLTSKTSKKIPKINSYNSKESTNNQNFPYITKNIKNNNSNSNYKNTNNNYYSPIKISKRTLSKDDLDENKIYPTKIFNNIFYNPTQNINIINSKIKKFQSNNHLNSFLVKKKDIFGNNNDNDNDNNNNYNDKKMINSKFKRKLSNNNTNYFNNFNNINTKKSSKKIQNLKEELDKELIDNDNRNNEQGIKNKMNKNKRIKKNKSEIKAKKEKEEEKIIDILYIGKNIINNCKIKNKIIYDIRPLNKTKERATIHFPEENNSKPTSENQSNTNTNYNSTKNITSDSGTNHKNLKYFRNSYSQFYSTFSNCKNNNIENNIYEEKEKEYEENNKNRLKKYELSEKELINLLNVKKEEENKKNIYIEINPEINNSKNNKKILSKIKYFNSNNNFKKDKNNLEYIDLGILVKELSDNNNKNNLHSFFGKEGNVIRGEKIKFLKTCYQVKLVKPLLSQHIYKFKTINNSKKIKFFSPNNIKFPPHHYNLDILKESNMKEINNEQNRLKILKKNISKYLTNLANHLDKEIKYK